MTTEKAKEKLIRKLLSEIDFLIFELEWREQNSFHHSLENIIDGSSKKEVISNAGEEAEITEDQVLAILKKDVKILSEPENMAALIKVFETLAQWRDEKMARDSVVEVSNSKRLHKSREDELGV